MSFAPGLIAKFLSREAPPLINVLHPEQIARYLTMKLAGRKLLPDAVEGAAAGVGRAVEGVSEQLGKGFAQKWSPPPSVAKPPVLPSGALPLAVFNRATGAMSPGASPFEQTWNKIARTPGDVPRNVDWNAPTGSSRLPPRFAAPQGAPTLPKPPVPNAEDTAEGILRSERLSGTGDARTRLAGQVGPSLPPRSTLTPPLTSYDATNAAQRLLRESYLSTVRGAPRNPDLVEPGLSAPFRSRPQVQVPYQNPRVSSLDSPSMVPPIGPNQPLSAPVPAQFRPDFSATPPLPNPPPWQSLAGAAQGEPANPFMRNGQWVSGGIPGDLQHPEALAKTITKGISIPRLPPQAPSDMREPSAWLQGQVQRAPEAARMQQSVGELRSIPQGVPSAPVAPPLPPPLPARAPLPAPFPAQGQYEAAIRKRFAQTSPFSSGLEKAMGKSYTSDQRSMLRRTLGGR